jgi:hypothetical protein
MAQKTWSYTGRGPLWLKKRGGNFPRLRMGNCSQLEMAAEEESAQLPDYQQPGGGLANEITRISSMSANITAYELSPQNIAIALRGLVEEITSGAVSAEAHTAFPDALVQFDFIANQAQTITPVIAAPAWAGTTQYAAGAVVVEGGHAYRVTAGGGGSSGASEPTWPTNGGTVSDGPLTWTDIGTVALVAGTDYDLSTAGLVPTSTGKLGHEAGTPITIAYTKSVAYHVEALTSSAEEWELVFEGLNEAESGRPVVVTLHRIKFSPTSALAFISEDLSFASLPMVASVLSAPEITGAGISKFMRVAMAA